MFHRKRHPARLTGPRKTQGGRTSAARSPRRRRALIIGVVIVAGVGVALSLWRWSLPSYADRLPRLPDLSRQTPAVREQLMAADTAARADSRSSAAVGALCTSYHSTMLYKEAIECYALAITLSPDDGRWQYSRGLAYSGMGQDRQAGEAFLAVAEHAPANGPAWWRLGEIAFKAGTVRRGRGAMATGCGSAKAGPRRRPVGREPKLERLRNSGPGTRGSGAGRRRAGSLIWSSS